ncbi:PAP-associated domain-containing protein [Caenorhabditis elegans]|uniref:PAP-associated domain-containing protein n=1 Tax=Caenorhabditis elegans TaxID=6239 RepID=I2HAE4_CAEEL|nr:PAP-associated domain-containing protein [Caenorhabditis elegans]CCH63851.1 PAP-associated domain-containing protein [Caenorhabditis elegans]|eukprot:NP_001256992.1 Uncharacterized protein CELE_F52D2.12 [Caenorhabditis elegans]
MRSSKPYPSALPNWRRKRRGRHPSSRFNQEVATNDMEHHIKELLKPFKKRECGQPTIHEYGRKSGRSHHGSVSFNGNYSINCHQLNHSMSGEEYGKVCNQLMTLVQANNVFSTLSLSPIAPILSADFRRNLHTRNNWKQRSFSFFTDQYDVQHSNTGSHQNGQHRRSFSDSSNNHGRSGNVSLSWRPVPAGFSWPTSCQSSLGQQRDVMKSGNSNQSFKGFPTHETSSEKQQQDLSRTDNGNSRGSSAVQDRTFSNKNDDELSDDVFLDNSMNAANGPRAPLVQAISRNLITNVFSKDGTELSVEQLLEIVSMKLAQYEHSTSSSHGQCSDLNRTLPAESDLDCSISDFFDSSFVDVNNKTRPEALIGERCLTSSDKSSKLNESLDVVPKLAALDSFHSTGTPVFTDCNDCPTPKRSGFNCEVWTAEVNNKVWRWLSLFKTTSDPAPLHRTPANPTEDCSQDPDSTSPPPRISESLTAFLVAQQDFNDYINTNYKDKAHILKVNLNIHEMSPVKWLYLNYFCIETNPRLNGPYVIDPRVPLVRNMFRRWFHRNAESCFKNPGKLAILQGTASKFVQYQLRISQNGANSSTNSTIMFYTLWEECIGQKNIISIIDACLLAHLHTTDMVLYKNAKRGWLKSILSPLS